MERKAHRTGRFLVRLLVLSLAGCVVSTLRRERPADPEPELVYEPPRQPETSSAEPLAERKRINAARRIAVGFALTTVFFAGAALTAGAGNEIAGMLEETASTTTEATAPEAAPADPSATVDSSAAEPASDPSAEASAPADASADGTASADDASAASDDDAPASGHGAGSGGAPTSSSDAPETAPADSAPSATAPALAPAPSPGASRDRATAKRHRGKAQWVLSVPRAKKKPAKGTGHATVVATARDEAKESPGAAPVIWLNRLLPDPTPPSRRLDRSFARRLQRISRANHVHWALVLGVLRAQGRNSSVPASPALLRRTARALAAVKARGDWNAALAVTGRTATADQAVALFHYDRAVGLNALVDGLAAHKDDLVNRVLHDGRATIYAGGRQDLASDRVDIRVVVLIEYLADTYGQVTVSCLISGHRLYARPGVVSAHIYGRAIDIADVGGIPVFGHQEPGSITERAVRAILLLPSELQPRQVISLLGLGGPSFPLANHDDHIHVGF
jgi:hypothetical protein